MIMLSLVGIDFSFSLRDVTLWMGGQQAQAANDAKSQFLATMSHEMRTPLNVIMGMNQLVMDTPLTEEQEKFAQQIKSSSESLLVLINDILDLTKIEAGACILHVK